MSSIARKIIASDKTGITLLSTGIFICLALWSAMVWGDFEASLFASNLPADKTTSTLRCPVVIARNELVNLSIQFKNTTERKLSTNVRTYLSQGYVSFIGEFDTPLRLEPGEVKKLEWQVDAKGAVWNRLVMVRIYSFRQFPYPAFTSTCGILVIGEMPFSASLLFWGVLLFGAATLFWGAYLIGKQQYRSKKARPGVIASSTTLEIIVFAGISLGLLGNWVPSALLLLVAILLLIVALATRILES